MKNNGRSAPAPDETAMVAWVNQLKHRLATVTAVVDAKLANVSTITKVGTGEDGRRHYETYDVGDGIGWNLFLASFKYNVGDIMFFERSGELEGEFGLIPARELPHGATIGIRRRYGEQTLEMFAYRKRGFQMQAIFPLTQLAYAA